jgi:hypothetical protein
MIAPDQARQRTRLLAALNDGVRLRASLADPAAAPGWVRCGPHLALAPRRAGGAVLPVLGDDGQVDAALALAALARIEPLLAAVEAALGIEILPDGLVATPPAGTCLAVTGADDDALLLAGEPALPASALRLDGQCRIGWALRLDGPLLPRPERVAVGDLLLGFAGTGAVRLGDRRLPARLVPDGAAITDHWRICMESDDPAGLADARVMVQAELAGAPMRLGDLSRLQPGAVLALADAGQVTVLANGAPFATGTLVPVGDGHGVLIASVLR